MKRLFFGGNIVTVGTDLPFAVLTENDRIAALLGKNEALSCDADEKIDLQGLTMIPSFIDPHGHFASYAMSLLEISLDDTESAEDIKKSITGFIENKKPDAGSWLTAKGYDHNRLPGGKHITRELLDQAAPANPLVVKHSSGHMGVFNTLALKILGVTRDTPDPEGGAIGRDDKGEPTGYMEENAFVEYLKKVPMPGEKQLMEAFDRAQKDYFAYGITTAQEGFVPDSLLSLYKYLAQSGRLEIDINGYLDIGAREVVLSDFPQCDGRYSGHFKAAGYKIFLDGSPQGRTAWMRSPYEGSESCGYGTMSDEQVYAAVKRSACDRKQLLAHCNGDRAAQQFIDVVAKAQAEGYDIRSLRPVMIHAQLVGKDQLPKLRELGIIPSFFVAHVYHWGDVHIKNFGFERACGISPAAAALKEGILFTFHQDSPVIAPDMLETIWCAAVRRTKGGRELGKDMAVSPYEALKAVTLNAAYQYFEENDKGSIAVGKKADLALLSGDILHMPADKIRDAKVVLTVKDGRTVYDAGALKK